MWTSRWSERRRDVRVDEQGLWLDGALAWKRSTIRHARVEREWLHGRGRLRVASIALGDDMTAALVAMRLDPERSVARFTMLTGSRVRSLVDAAIGVGGYFVAAALFLRGLGLEAAVVFLAALTYATVTGIRSYTRVEVGHRTGRRRVRSARGARSAGPRPAARPRRRVRSPEAPRRARGHRRRVHRCAGGLRVACRGGARGRGARAQVPGLNEAHSSFKRRVRTSQKRRANAR